MEKIRFRSTRPAGGGGGTWDGTTLVNTVDPWVFSNGFWETSLPNPAGRMYAGLFAKAPGLDPYVLHATMFSDTIPTATDYIAVKTRTNVYRKLWTPFPGNTRAALVRPDDIIEFRFANLNDQAWLEMLLEPLAATNEFGPVLLDLLREESRADNETPASTGEIATTISQAIPLWSGVLRVTCTNGAAINLTLPDASSMRLNNLLIISRQGAGVVNVNPAAGQTIDGAATFQMNAVNNAVWLRGSGIDWSLVAT